MEGMLTMFKYRIDWTNEIDFHINKHVPRFQSIKKVWLHASVVHIGFLPFDGFEKLEWVEVDEKNEALSAENGILFDKARTAIYFAPVKSHEYLVSKNITYLGSNAFSNCNAKISFEKGSQLQNVGKYAFYKFTGSRITLPNSVKSLDSCAFMLSIAAVDFEEGSQLSIIGEDAFCEYKGLRIIIPSGVHSIGDRAFEKCTSVSEITIPKSVSNIGKRAFAFCTANIIFEEGSHLEKIDSHTFESYSGTNIIIPHSVKSIGDYAFSNASKLQNIIIPNSVKQIGKYAFAYCTGAITFEEGSQLEEIDINIFGQYKGSGMQLPKHIKNRIRIIDEARQTSKPNDEKNKGFYLKLAGVTYNNRQLNIQKIKVGDELVYIREPENAYDKNAILIKTKSGLEIGYVPKENNKTLAQNIDNGATYKMVVSNITGADNQNKGVNIFVGEIKGQHFSTDRDMIDIPYGHIHDFDDFSGLMVDEPLYQDDDRSLDEGDSAWDPLDDPIDFDDGDW